MIQTKEFFGSSTLGTDEQINKFLTENQDIKIIDIKYCYCENTHQTQGYAMALLIYESGCKD
ncbi:hypothetical protein [Anoxybacteroides rupiense]|uniref:hypothetical protein n=1 Tax=Anoxybacteroides rupiense TaxID=311460 RepID=UPI001F09B74E|nr:hypothetical protein [Anoxybacillus rupiensis]